MGGACCALGSSTVWGPTYTDNYEASQIFADPEFADYTAVYAMYCDGGSWTGNLATPVTVGNATIHYKGRPLLDALIDWALDGGLSTASNLLYGGCSAGGLTSVKTTTGTDCTTQRGVDAADRRCPMQPQGGYKGRGPLPSGCLCPQLCIPSPCGHNHFFKFSSAVKCSMHDGWLDVG